MLLVSFANSPPPSPRLLLHRLPRAPSQEGAVTSFNALRRDDDDGNSEGSEANDNGASHRVVYRIKDRISQGRRPSPLWRIHGGCPAGLSRLGFVGCFIADARGTDHDYPSDHELAAAQDAVLKAQRQYDKLFQDASFDLEKTSS